MGKLWSMRLSKCLPQTSINHHKPHSFISCTKSLPRPQSLSLLPAPEWAPVWRWPHLLRGDPLFLLSAPGSWLQFHRHTIWVICMVSHMHITWQQITTCNPSKRIVANALVTRMMCNMHLCPTPVLRCCQAPEKFLLWAMQVVVWIASQVGCKAENRHHSETINMSVSPIFTDLVCLNTYHHPYIYHLISSWHRVSILIHDLYQPSPNHTACPCISHTSVSPISKAKELPVVPPVHHGHAGNFKWSQWTKGQRNTTRANPQPSLWLTCSWFVSIVGRVNVRPRQKKQAKPVESVGLRVLPVQPAWWNFVSCFQLCGSGCLNPA